jgi:hypothetical protein
MPPRIAVLQISDGRGLLGESMRSWHANARQYDLATIVHVDDSHHLLGFCGAIRYGWDRLRESKDAFDFVWHQEEDWRYDKPFSIAHMARVLDTEPRIAQVALRRGREHSEPAAVIDAFPEEFVDRSTGIIGYGEPTRSQEWLEHRLFWTTNPSLYRVELLDVYQWPEGPNCEASFTETLVADGASFAYWGDRHDPAWITHTGTRSGRGY